MQGNRFARRRLHKREKTVSCSFFKKRLEETTKSRNIENVPNQNDIKISFSYCYSQEYYSPDISSSSTTPVNSESDTEEERTEEENRNLGLFYQAPKKVKPSTVITSGPIRNKTAKEPDKENSQIEKEISQTVSEHSNFQYQCQMKQLKERFSKADFYKRILEQWHASYARQTTLEDIAQGKLSPKTGNPFLLENNHMVGAFLALHLYLRGRNTSLDDLQQMTYGDFKASTMKYTCDLYVVTVQTDTGSIGKLIITENFREVFQTTDNMVYFGSFSFYRASPQSG